MAMKGYRSLSIREKEFRGLSRREEQRGLDAGEGVSLLVFEVENGTFFAMRK